VIQVVQAGLGDVLVRHSRDRKAVQIAAAGYLGEPLSSRRCAPILIDRNHYRLDQSAGGSGHISYGTTKQPRDDTHGKGRAGQECGDQITNGFASLADRPVKPSAISESFGRGEARSSRREYTRRAAPRPPNGCGSGRLQTSID